jgi:primase-polymerase (primpol)-like protein
MANEFKLPVGLEELRALSQWVVANADKNLRDPKSGGQAKTNDPSTWGTFEQAAVYADKHGLRVGFVFTDADPFTGIDLDNKPERPLTPEQWAIHERILNAFESYTERSTSGRGYHIIVKGRVPAGVHNGKDEVEVYSSGRYFIMTGDVVRDAAIAECQPLLDRLYEEMRPAPRLELPAPSLPSASDLEVLAKVRARYGDRTDNLSRGNWSDYHPSQSEADLEYGIMLARFTSDADQWLRLFLQSALGANLERKGTPKHRREYLSWTYYKARRLADEENYHIEHGRHVCEAILANWKASIRNWA